MEGELCNDFSVDWFPPELRQKAEELEDALVSRTEASLPADELAKKAEIRRAILAQLDELPDKEQKNLVLRYFLAVLEGRGSKLSRACLHDSHDEGAAKARKEEQLEGEEAVIGEDFLCNDYNGIDIDIDRLILEWFDDERSLQSFFREVERDTLNYALIGADNKTIEKCCRNMSVRRARKLKDVLEHGGTIYLSYIRERRHEIIKVLQRLIASGRIYFEKEFCKEDYETAIKETMVKKTPVKKLPESITSNKEIKNKLVPPDTGSLSYADFVALYYSYMDTLCRFHTRARREGLLALDEELENIENEFFHLGLQLLVDGIDGSVIRSILSNYIAHETDYYKRILKQIIMEGVLYILDGGGSLEILIIQLNSMVSIKNNIISEKTAEYLCGDIHALDNCFDNIPSRPAPEEREEIVFIKRAFALSEKSRREGLLALEPEHSAERAYASEGSPPEIDKAAIASGDIFEYGLTLSIDGEESAVINSILGNLVAHESDPVKKNLCEAKKEALLSIHAGDNPRVLLAKYFSYFGDDVRQIARKLFDFDY